MSDIQTLVDMGFPKERAEYAIKLTNNKGVEPAMEWLLAHGDEEIPSVAVETASTPANIVNTDSENTASSSNAEDAQSAKSLKCDECNKLFKDQADVEYHAVKTGHSSFSESSEERKPLTEEEKKAQLALIEEKLKQKRIEREERERADAQEREKDRIKSGKDMTEARRRMEEIEMKKILDERKREKAEEKAARDRVRSQIESDKAARKSREQNQSVTSTTPASPTVTVTPSATSAKVAPKDYTHTRIQIRLQDGATLTETFNIKEQLSAVRVFIQMKTGKDSIFGLMTTFPRKVFSDEDYETPLDVLGLVPSAVLIMTKANT